jgi:hypothetical protein
LNISATAILFMFVLMHRKKLVFWFSWYIFLTFACNLKTTLNIKYFSHPYTWHSILINITAKLPKQSIIIILLMAWGLKIKTKLLKFVPPFYAASFWKQNSLLTVFIRKFWRIASRFDIQRNIKNYAEMCCDTIETTLLQ